MRELIVAGAYFDGAARHADGPYVVCVEDGRVAAVGREAAGRGALPGPFRDPALPIRRAPFAMPGLVEAHAHIVLDGGELDLAARSAYLKAPFAAMMDTARRNLQESIRHGITLVRDGGDRYRVNHAARAEARGAPLPTLRSAGMGIRRPARYGGLMAYEAKDDDEIEEVVTRIADEGADDLKIILSGIIDFATGRVQGDPQFDERALRLVVGSARARGLRTFAHCSGLAGLEVAVAAGVDSIEHGFFMNRDILRRMAEKRIAWVPTFSPVHFQRAHPGIAGWDEAAVGHLRRIVDDHLAHVALAHELGVDLVAGSDAGSHGVRHGPALVDELLFLLQAGIPMAAVLEAATSRPRRLWGTADGWIRAGAAADLVLLAGDPFDDPLQLRNVMAVLKEGVPAHLAAAGGERACA
jgi:imidazolonepropionase-like amidohydrolase